MKITQQNKLDAIEYKYYNKHQWKPKRGDYYTLTRNSMGLELFQIVEESKTKFWIRLVWNENGGWQDESTEFDKDTFLEDFGESRVYLPEWCITNEL